MPSGFRLGQNYLMGETGEIDTRRFEAMRELDSLSSFEEFSLLRTDRRRPLSSSSIALQLGVEEPQLNEIFSELDLQPIDLGDEFQGRDIYSHRSIVKFNIEAALYKKTLIPDALTEEEWLQRLEDALPELGISDIAKMMDRSLGWTSKTIEKLNIVPFTYVRAYGRFVGKYTEVDAQELRDYEQQWPRHDGWFNTAELEGVFQEDREWILRRLAEAEVEPEQRWSTSNRLIDHFPQTVISVLLEAQQNRPREAGSGWFTEEALESRLGKSTNWVRRRLPVFQAMTETLLDEMGVPRVHYPEDVLSYLENESKLVPNAEDYMTLSALASATGKHSNTIAASLDRAGIEPETRIDSVGRPLEHYPSYAYFLIVQELEDLSHPSAGDYISMVDLEKEVGRTRYWINQRLGRLSIEGELRRNSMHRLWMHYPPDAARRLRALSMLEEL